MRRFLIPVFAVFMWPFLAGAQPAAYPEATLRAHLLKTPSLKAAHRATFFEIRPIREAALLATGSYLLIHGKFLEKKLDGLNPAQLAALLADPPQKLGFAEKNHSATARRWSDYLLAPAFGTAATICFTEARTRRDVFRNGLVLGEAALLSLGSVTLAKNVFKKRRPFIYNDAAPVAEKLSPDARQSFFSGHTCTTATATFFSAKTWAANHPNSRLKPLVWTAAAIYPAIVGYLRMRGGKHYFRDVATGYLIGAAIGIGVPMVHLKR